jgi:hypothetical protein
VGSVSVNTDLAAAPTVTSVNSPAGTFASTCANTDYLNIYNAACTWLGSVHCSAPGPTPYTPVGVTFTAGATYQFGESTVAAPVYNSQESQTSAVLSN